jgi:chromosome segregation ATPase
VSSKKHPETMKKERICRCCVVEFKEIRLFAEKIQESRLELEQLNLEIQLAVKQHHVAMNERKRVQDDLQVAQGIKSKTDEEREENIENLKEKLSSLSVRHDVTEEKTRECINSINTLKNIYREEKSKLEELKSLYLQKEAEDEKIRRRVERRKRKCLEVFNEGKVYEGEIDLVGENVLKLREEIQKLERRIERKEGKTIERSKELEEIAEKFKENDRKIEELSEFKKSLAFHQENEDFSQEQLEKLSEANENILKYDEIIIKLQERIDLIKKNRARSLCVTSDNYEKKYRQCEILANISHMQKRNVVSRDKSGEAACQKCVIN